MTTSFPPRFPPNLRVSLSHPLTGRAYTLLRADELPFEAGIPPRSCPRRPEGSTRHRPDSSSMRPLLSRSLCSVNLTADHGPVEFQGALTGLAYGFEVAFSEADAVIGASAM